MQPTLVELAGVAKTYRRKQALHPLDLELRPGITGLLGPNGAGKTTLLSTLATVQRPSRGAIRICGWDTVSHGREARSALGYMPQRVELPGQLTGREFLHYAASMKGLAEPKARGTEVERVLAEVNLADRAGDRIRGYSGGMKQRLGIAQALLGDPPFAVFDEPTAGLDPSERIRFRNLLRRRTADRIVLLSTHIVSDIEAVCDEVVVLHEGRLRFRGSLEELAAEAAGRVWEAEVDEDQADALYAERLVIAGVRQDTGMRLRLLADDRPAAGARTAAPTLEDGYVAVLKGTVR
ncbi:ABC transporter ATP-binding protein [Paenibacillus sp. J31TS4]|uniref:ABC transporter ATP-binding protein n=1 Tax=Paenibacillus sp. J31TS4 TaxID=2807195 RepID=UPI001B0076C5|nr:ABC transporter ATP-binding protein [Paenibacillus sp. J31TS4]GIP38492.1 ABC transporter ATP-binding protein [Paenibacillus sp. J31TS4]